MTAIYRTPTGETEVDGLPCEVTRFATQRWANDNL